MSFARVEAWSPAEDDRLDELVRHTAAVARANRCGGVVGCLALAGDDRRERTVGALPALVAIHRVVAPDDGCDAVGGKGRDVVDGRVRRDVAPVGKRVHPGPVGEALTLAELEQRP